MSDFALRNTALDPTQSYIVSAPAGSGKTTLLAMRHLKGLLTDAVKAPESVLAISFTRKATAEMQQRILDIINMHKITPRSTNGHEQTLWDLGRAVAEKDRSLGWKLNENPSRLKIMTIDALCANLVKAAPLSADIGGITAIASQPERLYRDAVRQLLSDYQGGGMWTKELNVVLGHFNNNQKQVETLLADTLANRDQWLPIVAHLHATERDSEAMAKTLEHHNVQIFSLFAAPFLDAIKPYEHSILSSLQYAKKYLPTGKQTDALITLCDAGTLPTGTLHMEQTQAVISLASWVLKDDGTLRKTLTKKQGFIAKKDHALPSDALRGANEKKILTSLLADIAEDNPHGFIGIKGLSDPRLTATDHRLFTALMALLPILQQYLTSTFRQYNQVDFIEISLASLRVLSGNNGFDQSVLINDYMLKHLLIDEFQDTSTAQIGLIKSLTEHWRAKDGHSLFCVGDKMQSIYGFRASDVALFMNATSELSHLDLKPIALQENFRSQGALVKWNNDTFSTVCQKENNITFGATTYHNSSPTKPTMADPVSLNIFDKNGDGVRAEAEFIKTTIANITEKEPNASIAILGRNRRSLHGIIKQLSEANMDHQAIDIFPLENHPLVITASALTRAIMHLGDTPGWFGLLRSPLLGLDNKDLFDVLKRPYHESVASTGLVINKLRKAATTFGPGQSLTLRIEKFISLFDKACQNLGRKSLKSVIRGLFYELGGLSCAQSKQDIVNLDQFFDILDDFTEANFTLSTFNQKLARLYARSTPGHSNIDIMTIHAAKGLEFDYVFMPRLDAGKAPNTSPPFRFGYYYNTKHQKQPLFALHPGNTKHSCMYNSVAHLKNTLEDNELIRLAYVGTTRPKKSLFLTAVGQIPEQGQPLRCSRGTLLHILSQNEQTPICYNSSAAIENTSEAKPMTLSFLNGPNNQIIPTNDILATYRGIQHVDNSAIPAFNHMKETRAILGKVEHKVIQSLYCSNLIQYDTEQVLPLWSSWLTQEGCPHRHKHHALLQLQSRVKALLSDNTFRFLINGAPNRRSEHRISGVLNGKMVHNILDHVHETEDEIAIVDYKTMAPGVNESIDAFILRQWNNSHAQRRRYHQLVSSSTEKLVTVSVYLTALQRLVTEQDIINIERIAA